MMETKEPQEKEKKTKRKERGREGEEMPVFGVPMVVAHTQSWTLDNTT